MAPLFSPEGAKVVSQGIAWQSLYLVLFDHFLVLVEPARHSKGKGRVVTKCKIDNLTVSKDSHDYRIDTPARRLVMTCESPDLKPPGMLPIKMI